MTTAGTPLDHGDHAEAQQLAGPVTVTLPAGEPLLTSNQRLHWRARARLTKALRTTTAWTAWSQRITPFDGPVRITAVIHPKTARRFDPHNYQPSVKAAIDGLVDAGVLPDDNADIVREVAFVAGPKNRAGWVIRLVIEAVPGPGRPRDHAAAMRACPGRWRLVTTPITRDAADAAIRRIRRGQTAAYLPAGAFDAEYRAAGGVHQVWARYTAA